MEQRQKFKVGDRVRTLDTKGMSHSKYVGVSGTIEHDDGSDYRPLRVKLDRPIEEFGDTFLWVEHSDIASVAPTFKVGDRVRSPGYGPHWADMTVTDINAGLTWPVRCRNTAGEEGLFRRESLELIEEKVPAFKIGDRVQVAGENDGIPGKIVRVEGSQYAVRWDDDEPQAIWSASELYHLPPAPTLKPGARVRITAGAAAGEEGVVINLNGGAANVRTDDLYTDRAGQLMRHVSVGKSHVIPLAEAA